MISSSITSSLKRVFLALLLILAFCLLISLGFWQLQRAQQKRLLLATFIARTQQAPLQVHEFLSKKDLRYYPITLAGKFDNQHTFLLDNRTYHGQIGYEVYTPFRIKSTDTIILINRGWIPLGKSRALLPIIPALTQPTITGILMLPASYFSLGTLMDTPNHHWPMRIEFIDLQILSKLLGYPLFSYVLCVNMPTMDNFKSNWQVTMTITPEKHTAYAIQWFALAIGLLVVCVAFMCNHKRT